MEQPRSPSEITKPRSPGLDGYGKRFKEQLIISQNVGISIFVYEESGIKRSGEDGWYGGIGKGPSHGRKT